MTSDGLLVLIPTYDEYDNLRGLVEGVRTAVPQADVLVIDDASPDGTGKLADELAATDPQLRVLHRLGKQGLGVAYLEGYQWGLERGYTAFVQMDADGSHQPTQLPALLAVSDRADVVLGSRWVPGGSVCNWPRQREVLSRAGNAYTRLLLGLPVHDATGGYRVLHRRTLERLQLDQVASAGYCFQVDIVRRAVDAGCRVVEVPITFVERRYGVSKMDLAVVVESLVRITAWGLEHRLGAMRRVLSRRSRSRA